MKSHLIFLLIPLFLAFDLLAESKNPKADSLLHVIDTTSIDSIRIKALNKLSWVYMYNKPDTTKIIARSAIKIWNKNFNKSLLINSINDLATSFAVKGDFDSSLVYFTQAKTIAKDLGDLELKAMIQNNIGLVYWNQGKLDDAIEAYDLALEQYSQLDAKVVNMANAYNNLGLIHKDKGEFDLALESFKNAIDIFDSLNIKSRGVANTYNNIGTIYESRAKLPYALENFLKALKMLENIGDQSDGYANALTNIGNIFFDLNEYDKALEYYKRSKVAFEAISDRSNGLTNVLNCIGNTYKEDSIYDKALTYFNEAMVMQKEMGEQSIGMSDSYRNIGAVKLLQNNFNEAEDNFSKALAIQRNIGDKKGIAISLQYLGSFDINKTKFNSAIEKCKESLEIATQLRLPETKRNACQCLSIAYEKSNNKIEAFKYYKLFIQNRDSIINQENTRAITQKSMRYEFDKIQYSDSLDRAAETKKQELVQKEKDLIKEAEIRRQRTYTILGGVGFLFMLGLAFVLFRGYKNKQKANEIITAQKEQVEEKNVVIEEKNREILDSINYAKRIQNTILPSEKTLKNLLPEAFVFFQPKDIVSGDFYWIDEKDDFVFFAAVDCTGHGVPGALVSVVGHNGLKRVLNEFKIIEPGLMLDKLNQLVEDTFSQSEESIKDGMDLALCRLNRKTNELVYAGANNPLYIVRKLDTKNEFSPLPEAANLSYTNKSNMELYEIKSDKQPIGKYDFRTAFTSHSIKLEKGDSLYIFSDGYADQFGGKKGKKFMYKPFKRLITDLSELKMKAQEKKLFYAFDKWKGELEQIDDVCVMGVRV